MIHGRCFVNESSPFGFVLEDKEAAIYKYFAGKLTLGDIAARLAGSGDGRVDPLDTVIDVYKKCEDRLAVAVAEF